MTLCVRPANLRLITTNCGKPANLSSVKQRSFAAAKVRLEANSIRNPIQFSWSSKSKLLIGGVSAALVASCGVYALKYKSVAYAASSQEDDEEADAEKKKRPLTIREKRFLRFASIEFDGQIYMTPRDFLDSVTQENPRHRIHRRSLEEKEVEDILRKTPPRTRWWNKKGSSNFFRTLDSNGLISFTEYLFLLCVLTKPKSGFQIAFNMFDMDGNKRVDKREFLVIQALTLMLRKDGKIATFDEYLDNNGGNYRSKEESERAWVKKTLNQLELLLEDIWGSKKQKDTGGEKREPICKRKATAADKEELRRSVWDKQSNIVEQLNAQDTTLLRFFFGPRGDSVLSYEDFEAWSESLQAEILEIEFNEFAKGKPTISETDFAKMLLRYTVVHADDYRAYLDRVAERIPEEKGVTFDQFRQFCQFLNNLDDFSIAMKLYTFADLPVSQAEFARAVKVSTGYALDPHVIHTVFQVFDVNNDGRLSYSEFIAVMKDRIHRGFRSHLVGSDGILAGWKSCVREEMKNY